MERQKNADPKIHFHDQHVGVIELNYKENINNRFKSVLANQIFDAHNEFSPTHMFFKVGSDHTIDR